MSGVCSLAWRSWLRFQLQAEQQRSKGVTTAMLHMTSLNEAARWGSALRGWHDWCAQVQTSRLNAALSSWVRKILLQWLAGAAYATRPVSGHRLFLEQLSGSFSFKQCVNKQERVALPCGVLAADQRLTSITMRPRGWSATAMSKNTMGLACAHVIVQR